VNFPFICSNIPGTPAYGVYIYIYEEFEDVKGVIRIRKSKKDRQHYCQKKKDKRANIDLSLYDIANDPMV